MPNVDAYAWSCEAREGLQAAVARHMGVSASALEVERVALLGGSVEAQLRRCAPVIVELPGGEWIGVVDVRGNSVRVLTPELAVRALPLDDLRTVLCGHVERSHVDEVERVVAACAIAPRRLERVRAALLRERVRTTRVAWAWQPRVSPGSSFWHQLRDARLLRCGATFLLAHAAETIAWVAAWWMVGRGALEGHFDEGWLAGWGLLLFTMTVLRVLATRSQGVLSIGIGGLLKQRLLAGAVTLEPDAIRHHGVGQHLARVLESEQLESLASSGGLLCVMALVETMLALVVIALGAGGVPQAALLATWTAVAGWMAWRYGTRRAQWTSQRLTMTHSLIENMSGHRTRIVQQSSDDWHREEDKALDRYLEVSEAMDREGARLSALIPRGWLVLGFIGMAPALLATAVTPGALAIALGGMLLAHRGLKLLVESVVHLSGARIAWAQVAPLFRAAALPEQDADHSVSPSPDSDVLLDARDLSFGYRRDATVLNKCHVRVHRGERVLLEGSSGAGKSTLLALLSGLRTPDCGVLLNRGLDQQTLGSERWRRSIVCAPQYHENHVVTGSLAFNLLLGRGWPATREDFDEATTICGELGLGDLIQRMPAGLQQMVGEGGWQLSQGEKSRLFLARALLQRGDVVVLDESFAALDPETLRRSLECALKRAPTLLVTAHV